MARDYYVPIDMHLNEMWNMLLQKLASDPAGVTAQIFFHTGRDKISYKDSAGIKNVASENYVDAVAQGLSVKGSCKLATIAALPTNTYANGTAGVGATLTATSNAALTVDSVLVAVADRILVKDEASQLKNGIYVVTATGSGAAPYVLTRSTDMDVNTEVQGAFTFVEAGTTNISSGFVCPTTGSITMGTTAITFTQFSGAGEILVTAPITKSGNTLSLSTDGVTVYNNGSNNLAAKSSASTSDILKSQGSGDAAWNKWKYAADIGDGVTTSIVVTHGIVPSTKDLMIQLYNNTAPYSPVECDVQRTSTTTTTLVFSIAPTTNQFRVVIMG